MHYSISQLAREFGLSRSTLLYYDSTGLLKPQQRAAGDYRVYTESHYRRLEQICRLRSTGLSLEEIKGILQRGRTHLGTLLQERLGAINEEMNDLRLQQRIIIDLLSDRKLLKGAKVLTKEMWVSMLTEAGLDEEGRRRWHQNFEKTAPEAHRDFLQSLGLSKLEIRKIRQWARLCENG